MKKSGIILIMLLFFSVPGQAWEKIYGGNNYDVGNSVCEASDGGDIIAGWTASFGAGQGDVYLIKTDASGDSIWTRTYGGSSYDGGNSVCETSDGGYIIAGWTLSFGAGAYDVYLIKTDASGDTVWTRTYGGSDIDEGYSVCETSDGGYIIAGGTYSFGAGQFDVYIIKTDASGDTVWTSVPSIYACSEKDVGYSVCEISDEGYIITGMTEFYNAGGDVYLIKIDAEGVEEAKEAKYAPRPLLEVRSPSDGKLDLSFFLPISGLARVELYDAAGKRVAVIEDDERQTGWHHITQPLSLPCGIYFVQLYATLEDGYKLSSSSITQKIILVGN